MFGFGFAFALARRPLRLLLAGGKAEGTVTGNNERRLLLFSSPFLAIGLTGLAQRM